MGDGYFLDIIFLAMVAAFVFLRLRGVLGRRTGNERRRDAYGLGGEPRREAGQRDDTVIPLPERGAADAGPRVEDNRFWTSDTPAAEGLTEIQIADRRFTPESFLEGARAAYRMVVEAFAAGDRETLRMLLNDEVFDNFTAAVEQRAAANQTLESRIVKLRRAEITGARLAGTVAEVTVKFVSDMVSVMRGPDGEPMPGYSETPRDVTDIWTFARDTASSDPNWQLIETSSEE
ncbi:MAG TPA: Tim44/TimA family putative adaptor protein [Alphaproteobacteria bacterium]|jgi:predicted lipid-binding transport protein (Tim44 family)|nr:Tim44/TimA family putative adaptor protein [Alphaproteobacteria bacterium]